MNNLDNASIGSDFPIALLVEDNPSILEKNIKLLQLSDFFAIGASSKEAARRELRACPSVDIVITDISLNPNDHSDRSGIELAQEIKERIPGIPIVGYSAYFEEGVLPKENLDVFISTRVKSKSTLNDMDEYVEKWRKTALDYRASRVRYAYDELDRIKNKYIIDQYDFNILREFVPSRNLFTETADENSIEEILRKAGYQLSIIETGQKLPIEGYAKGHIKQPIIIWLQRVNRKFVSEMYGFPELYAIGDDENKAIEQLLLLMDGYHHDLRMINDDELSPSLIEMKEYLKKVFGNYEHNN